MVRRGDPLTVHFLSFSVFFVFLPAWEVADAPTLCRTAPIVYASITLPRWRIRGFISNTLHSTGPFRDILISNILHIDMDPRADLLQEAREIMEGCPRLRSVAFVNWGMPLSHIPPGLLRVAALFPAPSLLPASNRLTHLELYNPIREWPGVAPLASSFPSLTHLLLCQCTHLDHPTVDTPLKMAVEKILTYLTPSMRVLVLRAQQVAEGNEQELVERVIKGEADMRLLLEVDHPRYELMAAAEGWLLSHPRFHSGDQGRDPHSLWMEADRIIERRREEPQALQRLGGSSFCEVRTVAHSVFRAEMAGLGQ